MNLIDELKKIYAKHGEINKLKVRVTCINGDIIEGPCMGVTSALDNEPEVAQIDVSAGNGSYYGLLETEIKKIEVI